MKVGVPGTAVAVVAADAPVTADGDARLVNETPEADVLLDPWLQVLGTVDVVDESVTVVVGPSEVVEDVVVLMVVDTSW